MRWAALLLLSLLFVPTSAGAVVFYGREGWTTAGTISLQWAPEYGLPPGPASFPPMAGMAYDTTVSSALTGSAGGCETGATLEHHLSAAGTASPGVPVFTWDMHTWGSCPDGGLFSHVYDQANFDFEPAVMGESLHVLVHWHVIATGPQQAAGWSLSHGDVLIDQNSGWDGYTSVVLQGPDYRYYVLRLTLAGGGGITSGYGGDQDLRVHLDFYVGDAPLTGVEPGPGASALALSAPAPNPVRDVTTFALDLPHGGAANFEIVDLSGRIVREMGLGDLGPGRHSLSWDRRDDRGARVAPGVYWARVTLAGGGRGESAGRRVVVLR